jgi:hypothetical protein
LSWFDWLGVDMTVVGVIAIALEVVLLLPGFLRLTKRLTELTLLYNDNLRLTRDELQNLSLALSETQTLLQPYRPLQRWLGHPLTLALFASYRRRRKQRRSRSPAG